MTCDDGPNSMLMATRAEDTAKKAMLGGLLLDTKVACIFSYRLVDLASWALQGAMPCAYCK